MSGISKDDSESAQHGESRDGRSQRALMDIHNSAVRHSWKRHGINGKAVYPSNSLYVEKMDDRHSPLCHSIDEAALRAAACWHAAHEPRGKVRRLRAQAERGEASSNIDKCIGPLAFQCSVVYRHSGLNIFVHGLLAPFLKVRNMRSSYRIESGFNTCMIESAFRLHDAAEGCRTRSIRKYLSFSQRVA